MTCPYRLTRGRYCATNIDMNQAAELLTTQEVADTLRVSRASVSRWAKTGVLSPIRVGGIVRFRRTEVDALLEPATPETAA